LELLNKSKISNDLHRILFIIDANPCVVTTKPFADISSYSYFPDESEILFMIGSIFRLLNIYQNNEQIWIIQLILCGDDEHDLKNLFEYMKESHADSDNEATLLSFGQVLYKMSKYDQAEKYYYRLLNEPLLNNSSRSHLYYSLGLVTMDKGNYDLSLMWLNKSLEIKMQTNPYEY
jgi:tetratricopeptide (TPR) repeat protein